MKFKVGQLWKSSLHPHEDFVIYDSISNLDEEVLLWKRVNEAAFDRFVTEKKGFSFDELIKKGKNTYPYAWTGWCSSKTLKAKIKKFNMILSNLSE